MGQFPSVAARRFVSGSRQLDCRRRETIHLPLEKRWLGHTERIENKHRSLSRQSKDTDHQPPERCKHHSLQQRSVYSRLRGVEQHLQGRTKKGMQGTEGSLQRRVSGNIQRSRKRVCQSGISIGYGRHDLYGKHPAPPRRRSGATCGAGRATERYCHPGAQEQKHSFNSRLLRQEHLLQNRIRWGIPTGCLTGGMYDNGWPALLVTTRKPDCQGTTGCCLSEWSIT